MRTADLTLREWEPEVRLQAADQHDGLNDDFLGFVDGEPAIGQFTDWGADEDTLKSLTRFLRFGVKFQTIKTTNKRGFVRMSGIRAANEYFGTTPPEPPKKRYACRDGRLYDKEPAYRKMIDEISVVAWRKFQQEFPMQQVTHWNRYTLYRCCQHLQTTDSPGQCEQRTRRVANL